MKMQLQFTDYCSMNFAVICFNEGSIKSMMIYDMVIYLQTYPFDWHTCEFTLRPFQEPSLRLLKLSKVSYVKSHQSPEFFHAQTCSAFQKMEAIQGFNYTLIGYHITLQRMRLAKIISHYVPVTLYTWASFTSFDLRNSNLVGDRIGFLVTLFMVVVSMIISQTNSSPGGNQITSIGEIHEQFRNILQRKSHNLSWNVLQKAVSYFRVVA